MTMGPAPMMRMDFRSVRLGMNVDFAESWGRRNTRQAGKRAGSDYSPHHGKRYGGPMVGQGGPPPSSIHFHHSHPTLPGGRNSPEREDWSRDLSAGRALGRNPSSAVSPAWLNPRREL